MKLVYKYEVNMQGRTLLPIGAEILRIESQHGTIQLWALIEPDNTFEARAILIAATGELLPENAALRHINTFLMDDGNYVFHAFEETS